MSATSHVNVNVFLADHSAIHRQPKCSLCGQQCQECKQLSFKPPSPQHITSYLKKIPTKVIHPSVRDHPGLLLLVALVVHSPSNNNPHVLNVVRHDESKNNFHNNHHHHSISRPSWKNFNWYILMSGTSLVYSILLSLPSTVSSTAKSHVFNVVRDIGHIKSIKNSRIAILTTAYHTLVKENFNSCDTF